MQRPRSEGRRPASHSPSMVSRSLQLGTGDYRQDSDLSNPRRPNTTPKPRIQRLLPTPGQNSAQDWHSSRQSIGKSPSVLINLPDSPPSLRSVNPNKDFSPARETNIVAFDVQTTSWPVMLEKVVDPATARVPSDSSNPSLELIKGSSYGNSDDKEDAKEGASVPDSTTISLEPEGDDEGEDRPNAENGSTDDVGGPILADIRGLKSSVNDDIDEDEYRKVLADRARLLDDEANRQRIREELETYVYSLGSRTDDDGEHLVEFPRNYQQIVSLMTQKDVREESEKSHDGKVTRQSWSRVLIESGLSKQQAFGILEDGDDDPDGNNSLAAKIALKMAHIRQLDTILEEKLGKTLYSSIIPRKQKRAKSPSLPAVTQDTISRTNTTSTTSRTFVTQTQAIVTGATASTGNNTSRSQSNSSDIILEWTKCNCAKNNNNFIERNKQVVANGMKANMTKDEEDRLEKLLSDEATPSTATDSKNSEDTAAGESNNADTGAVLQECNEFTMSDSEKEAIDELIASKSCSYPLFAIDEQDGITDDTLLSPRDSKSNVIQETKRDRLQRKRLSRVEQELRFLQHSPSVVIVGDDYDGGENDDCRSEISYATVASSACSTRSGVISRHDFRCFLAQQKESFHSTPTASADEIRRLLLSMGHGVAVSSSTVAATTG